MEKKGNQLGLYSVFFIASVLTELYCLLQFRDDYIVVIGIGAVVLIATYLLMDSFCSEYGLNGKGRTKDKEEQEDAIEELRNKKGLKQLLERVEEIGKIQKALYVSNKKIEESLTKEIQQLSNNMVKVGKLVTKYNQQDTKALFQLEKDTKEDINNQLEQLIDLLNTINHLFSSGAISSFSAPTADEEIIIKQNNESEIELNNLDQELEKVQEIDNMVNKMTEEPKEELKTEPEMELKEEELLPEDIEGLFAAAGIESDSEEKETKEEPSVSFNLGDDPNKPMTPEEIAAFISSMNQ